MTYVLKYFLLAASVLLSCTKAPQGEEPTPAVPQIEISEGTTSYGIVSCEGKGISGVMVSDGVLTTLTDENGLYQLASEKKYAYVFISTPSGYTVRTNGVLPQFYACFETSADKPERKDFELVSVPDQDKHTAIVIGDIQMCGMNRDVRQMQSFIDEMNQYAVDNSGKSFFAMTLGDMTWDVHWVENHFGIPEYLAVMNGIEGVPIYQTIGNHDYELEAAGDFDTTDKFRKYLGPTSYSFNCGKIHYISLDAMVCNNDGAGTRKYAKTFSPEVLDWLDKDLSYLPKSTQVVVFSHVAFSAMTNASDLISRFQNFTKPVHYFTAHNHVQNNIDNLSATVPYYEHNTAALSGDLFVAGTYTPSAFVCVDGTPGGYNVLTVDGEKLSWRYKALGHDIDYQFRAYDRASIALTASKYLPAAYAQNQTAFNSMASDWSASPNSTKVFVHVWDYDPSWKIEITENGVPLTVKRATKSDPYYILVYGAKYYNTDHKVSAVSAGSSKQFFEATASSQTSTLEIRVTDRFGNVSSQSFTRPMELTENNYPLH